MKRSILFALLLTLCGCGGGASTTIESTHAQPMFTNIVVIGNSLAYHPASTAVDWSGNWGMAASSEGKDFAHLTATHFGAPLTVVNFADIERTPLSAIPQISTNMASVGPGSLVVIELGDLVTPATLGDFQAAYRQLLQSSSTSKRVVCLSTFWRKDDIDVAIRSVCANHGATYANIGDIYGDPANPDYRTQTYTNIDVQGHPHDWGMSKISERIVAAVEH